MLDAHRRMALSFGSEAADSWHPRQFLRPCLLLLLGESTAHGYDLLEKLRDFGLERDAGGLYRTLRAMEHEGLVVSQWEASSAGPDRRIYSLTDRGRRRLHDWTRGLAETQQSIDRFLKRFGALAREPL